MKKEFLAFNGMFKFEIETGFEDNELLSSEATNNEVKINRKAERQDVPLLLEFIKGIARYGKMENEVIASPEVLERELFDEHRAEALFAAEEWNG